MEYYKITNKSENHYEFQYKDGLNVLIEPFNDNPGDSCCEGGLYFTDIKNILKFVSFGCYVREVFLPLDDPDFKMVKDPSNDKWRANKIILGQKYNLWDVKTLELLRQKGTNDEHFKYLLNDACAYGYSEIIKYFVENNLIDYKENYYIYSLSRACENGHYEIVKLLVEKIKIPTYRYGMPLYFACIHGHYKIVELFVESGVDISTNNETLNGACVRGQFDIVKYLVGKGANVNGEPLHCAARCGDFELFKYLIDKGSDIHIQDDELFQCAVEGGDCEIIKFLIKNKIRISSENNSHALINFILGNNFELIRLLINNGGNSIRGQSTPLYHAAKKGNSRIFRYLINKGADIYTNSYILFKYAIKGNNSEIIEFLAKEIDTYVKDDLLYKYIKANNFEVVNILINNGANIDNSALQICTNTDNYDMFKYLFQRKNIRENHVLSYSVKDTKIYTDNYILYSAMKDNNIEFIKFLIYYKIIKNSNENISSHQYEYVNNSEIINLLKKIEILND